MREPRAVSQRNPPVRVAPENQCGRLHMAQAPAKTVEPELSEHASQGAPIARIGNRRVVLIDVRFGDLRGIGECRPQDATCDPTTAKRCRYRSHEPPARHLEYARPAHAIPGRVDQYEAADPIRVVQRDFRGDRAAHRMTDQYGTRNTERVEQRYHAATSGGS